MEIGFLSRRFPAVNRQVPCFELQAGEIPLQTAQVDVPAGNALQRANYPKSNFLLKLRAGEIQASCHEGEQDGSSEQRLAQNASAKCGGRTRRENGGFAARSHCALTPWLSSPTLISLCTLRSFNQADKSSFIRRCVSNSSILGETSTSGISWTPDLRNSGSN